MTTLARGELRPVDEHANLATHALGLALSLFGCSLLLELVRDASWQLTWSVRAYCVSLAGLYAASTLSHAFYSIPWRRLCRTRSVSVNTSMPV